MKKTFDVNPDIFRETVERLTTKNIYSTDSDKRYCGWIDSEKFELRSLSYAPRQIVPTIKGIIKDKQISISTNSDELLSATSALILILLIIIGFVLFIVTLVLGEYIFAFVSVLVAASPLVIVKYLRIAVKRRELSELEGLELLIKKINEPQQ
jgi:hypothetical protein